MTGEGVPAIRAEYQLEPKAYSVGMAAEVLSVSVTTVRRLIRSGELRAFRIGDRVMVRPSAIDDFLDAAEAS